MCMGRSALYQHPGCLNHRRLTAAMDRFASPTITVKQLHSLERGGVANHVLASQHKSIRFLESSQEKYKICLISVMCVPATGCHRLPPAPS